MTSGGRTRRILDLAHKDATFRNKVIKLGALGDQMTYPTTESLMQFAPQMLEVAGEAGLLEGIDQAAFDELNEWISDSANELAYLVSPRQRMAASPKFAQSVGHVFVSWTVKNPRDREATRGVKAALDWFNIDYFDYTEHQLDDEADKSGQITQQLKDAIAKSRFSVEIVSTEVDRPWVQFERSLIAENASIHRFFVCLEWEKVRLVRMSKELEARVTRIDMSGGRWGHWQTTHFQQWAKQASDTRYFTTPDFFYRCYELGELLRSLLTGRRKRHPIFSFLDSYRFNMLCQQLRQSEMQAMAIRTGLNCQSVRLENLVFPVPMRWRFREKRSGHWIFKTSGVGPDISINVMIYNAGRQPVKSAAELNLEIEATARQLGWKLMPPTVRQFAPVVEGIDVVAEMRHWGSRRFVNFCYNGREYWFEIVAMSQRSLAIAKPLLDAWIDAFQFQPLQGKSV